LQKKKTLHKSALLINNVYIKHLKRRYLCEFLIHKQKTSDSFNPLKRFILSCMFFFLCSKVIYKWASPQQLLVNDAKGPI
jgi:hypothetical protein